MRAAPLIAALLLCGCPAVAPSCDDVCESARPAFESCLLEWRLQWGDAVGYTDAADYDDWCGTWVTEQRLLAETSHDVTAAAAALEQRCTATIDTLEASACASYWSLWD
jgi:hypothetical protein